MNADFRIIHFNIVDHRPQPGPPERDCAIEHVSAHDIDEGCDLLRRNPRLGLHLGDGPVKGDLRDIALRPDRGNPVLQRRIGGIGNAVLDRLIEPIQPVFRVRQLAAQSGQTLAVIGVAGSLALHEARQQLLHALRRQQLIGQPFGHRAVELIHRDRPALASCLALLRAGSTGIVAIATGLAGTQGHAATAAGAGGNPGQQDRSRHSTRRGGFGIAGFELRLHGIESGRVDDRIDRHDNLFRLGLPFPRLPSLAIESMLALVGRAGDKAVQRADAPPRALAGAVAALVQPAGRRLHAHRAGRAVAFADQPEDQSYSLGLNGIDRQLLLGLGPALLSCDDGVAERGGRAVPEALPRVLLHRAQDVLGVLFRLVFVEQGEDLPDHHAHRVVAKVLRNADEPDAMLAQAAHVVFKREVVARETAETMDHDGIERRAARRGDIKQALELRPVVVRTGQTGIDELRRHLPSPRRTEIRHLPPLVRDREVAFRLPAGGHAHVERGALRQALRRVLRIRRGCGGVAGHRGHFRLVRLFAGRFSLA